MQLAQEIPNLK